MSTKFWKSVCPTLFKYHGDIVKTDDNTFLLCRFSSSTYIAVFKSSKWKSLYKQCDWWTAIRGDWVDDRNPSKTLLGALTEAQKSYLCQPVLSAVDDSSHMICNLPLCALKIEIYCICFVYFSLPAVWKCLK